MRVTKLIREYVEKTVSEKFKTPTEKEVEHQKLKDKLQQFASIVDAEVRDFVNQRIADFIEQENIPQDITLKPSGYYTAVKYDTANSQTSMTSNRARDERIKRKNEAIENILLTLELGGTKADLDRMIAEL
jgi:hypothetical protein